jgi:hypothetical protein
LRENLILYDHGRACRTPWQDDDPIFKPVFAPPGVPTDLSAIAEPEVRNSKPSIGRMK